MRKLAFVPVLALLAWGCSDSTDPPVPTTVVIAPTSVTLSAVGATQVVHAAVTDAKGKAITKPRLTWASNSPSVTVVGAGGDSAVVTAAKPGPATVTATAGSASGSAPVVVLVNANIAVLANGHQAAIAGTVLGDTPTVVVRAPGDVPVAGITVNFAVTSGGGSIATTTGTTDANGVVKVIGWRLGTNPDLNTLTATAVGITGGPVTLRGVGCSGGGGTGYSITLCLTTPMTASQRAAFTNAAARWATIVKGDLPDVGGQLPEDACSDDAPSANFVYDDLLIFAAVTDIDGPGQVLGQAGPCFVRLNRGLPVIGVMEFDAADLTALETNNQLGNVILHEMGHVLGIGSMWEYYGVLGNKSSASSSLDTYFTGAGGRAGFDAIGGTTYTGGQKAPVENTGGAGTINSHWRESVLRNELMTGFLNGGTTNPLSVMTVRSLADIGYTVDPAAADNFFLTLSLRAPGNGTAVELHDDVYRGPLFTISPRGQLARLR